MKDYNKIVKSLRHCSKAETKCEDCAYTGIMVCYDVIKEDAADAIEELQKGIDALAFKLEEASEMLKKSQEELLPKHGEWLGTEYDGYADGNPVFYEWMCSSCGCIVEDEEPTWNFCPNCGAKMDGKENEE